MIKNFWDSLGLSARIGLAGGVIAVLAVASSAGWWLLRNDEQVLFADIKPQDAAVMVAELERMKVAHRIAGDGTTILVAAPDVHATRLKLMSKDLPLHGTTGFELFNNADFGVTEFAQKINYQRALQGEITRTILSLSAVKDARVHLALPEEGLFKRSSSKPKAAVTLALRSGEELRTENIMGIQRLVAGAVPGIAPQDVTILDERGVALSRPPGTDGEIDANTGRLDLKRDTERHLARKVTDVLERAFGAGQILATVDATLNMDQVRVTTEDVLGAPRAPGQAATGVMVRERENVRDGGPPLNARGEVSSANTQREVDYQVGRRVEHVAMQPGAIRRLHVAAVISRPLDAKQVDQVRQIVAAAAGVLPERGDTVIVQSLPELEAGTKPEIVTSAADRSHLGQSPDRAGAAPAPAPAPAQATELAWSWMWGIVGAVLLGAVLVVLARRRHMARQPMRMTESERERLLGMARLWLEGNASGPLPAPLAREKRP